VIELDGVPVDPEQLKALALYNYGHFTSMRVQDGGVRGLSLHLRRLVDDCRALFDAELDPGRVRLVRHALRDVDRPTVVRVTVLPASVGDGKRVISGSSRGWWACSVRPFSLDRCRVLRAGGRVKGREATA
jgi:branched-subunit amino acid aminotransferase/4-amino-4-deoxychorismate lyase